MGLSATKSDDASLLDYLSTIGGGKSGVVVLSPDHYAYLQKDGRTVRGKGYRIAGRYFSANALSKALKRLLRSAQIMAVATHRISGWDGSGRYPTYKTEWHVTL